jgi:hypothetical protein
MRRIGLTLVGPNFDVTGLHRDREDAFVAAITNQTVCALDNADSRIPWPEDSLATYATGLRYRLRRLYTTNEEVSYEPRAMLLLSSRDPHFNRPDVAERLLPFHFERPQRYTPEERLCREIAARWNLILGELLDYAGRIADALADAPAPALPFRMAEYAAFGWHVFRTRQAEAEWLKLLARLERVQVAVASDGDGVVAALQTLLARDQAVNHVPVGDLYKQCRTIAEAEGLPFPRTAQGFGRRLTSLRRVLELELAVAFRDERGHADRRWISLIPGRQGGEGGGGGDVGEHVSDLEGGR